LTDLTWFLWRDKGKRRASYERRPESSISEHTGDVRDPSGTVMRKNGAMFKAKVEKHRNKPSRLNYPNDAPWLREEEKKGM